METFSIITERNRGRSKMKKHYELYYRDPDYKPIYLMNGTKDDFILRASPLDKGWSKPGEPLCELKDTGNGIILTLSKQWIELDYCEAEKVRLALKLNQPDVQLNEITKKRIK